jgi:hypothetical protein
MSEIKVNKISPKQTCTQLTLGDSGDTIIIPAGATITNNGTATGFGATGAVNWDTTPKTTTVTAVSGTGYFVNTTAGAVTVNLPAGVAGAIVAISDYANTAATNNITVAPNGTDKINGINQNAKITTNGVAVTLIYVDSTRGWKDVNDATLDVTGIPPFVAATGGTITTCGDYKIHTFTGPGTFTVTSAGTPAGSTKADYLVVAGGGGGSVNLGAGGGGGGFRESYNPATSGTYSASPLATPTSFTVSVTSYPITIGAGGTAGTSPCGQGGSGTSSIFSTITSAGGGGGGNRPLGKVDGGSGGGAAYHSLLSPTGAPGGSGNTPPVSPPQGQPGGTGSNPIGGGNPSGPPCAATTGTGGGGATQAGFPNNGPPHAGGAGAGTNINTATGQSGPGPSRYYSGGGGSGYNSSGSIGPGGIGGGGVGNRLGCAGGAGTTNTGGGGGGACGPGGAGGSGIVVIRYKFQ